MGTDDNQDTYDNIEEDEDYDDDDDDSYNNEDDDEDYDDDGARKTWDGSLWAHVRYWVEVIMMVMIAMMIGRIMIMTVLEEHYVLSMTHQCWCRLWTIIFLVVPWWVETMVLMMTDNMDNDDDDDDGTSKAKASLWASSKLTCHTLEFTSILWSHDG